jgi:hypothetical protein
VWESPIYGYPDFEIRGQRFASDGSPQGAEIQLNSDTAGRQRYPDVSMAANGDFVAVWHNDPGLEDFDVAARCFSSDGTAVGTEFYVNTYTSWLQAFGVLARTTDDEFLVVWKSHGSLGDDDSNASIQSRLYKADGTPLTSQLQVNTYTTYNQEDPAVASQPDGSFVVVWSDGRPAGNGQDGSGYGVFAREITGAGTPIGDEFQVNAYTTSTQRAPAVAQIGGTAIIVWHGYNGEPEDQNVSGRVFATSVIFADSFEAGTTAGWSNSLP